MAGKKSDSKNSYKVFVSSTYLDNIERRKLVQDAITTAGMVWHGMEIFTASSQPTVKECLRHVKEADLFVGIISWRYGWEPDGKKSITEMEYDAAKANAIDRLMFQIDRDLPVNIEKDFDPGPDRHKKQEKLDAFKERFAKDQLPAIFKETTLQAKVLKALNDWREARESGSDKGEADTMRATKSGSKPDKDIDTYCQKAASLYGTIPVAGFITQIKVPIDIEEIYVPLHAVVDLRAVNDGKFADAAHAEKTLRECDSSIEISLLDAFKEIKKRNQSGLVILGDPGSGKTTHLKRLLLYCLREGPENLGLSKDMLPVFLPLRELRNLDKGLDFFIQQQLSSPHLNTPADFGKRLLDRENLLLLFDGLDEVADLKQREKVAKWIVDAIICYPTCRFVVTCRFAGYSETVRLSEKFLEMHIRPFSAEQAEKFIRNWYKIVEKGLAKDPDQASGIAFEKSDNLIKRLKEPDFRAQRVFELTRNPLLLANICLVHRHRGTLPAKRARLYEECIDLLLEHWREAKGIKVSVSAQNSRRALQPVAFWLHSEEGRTRANAEEIAPHIAPVLKSIKWENGSAADFLRTIRDESGLLTGWDQDTFGFMHLGFQEYLAAREIRNLYFKDQSIINTIASHFGESWWQEVGLLMLSLEEPSLFEPYMREVVKQPAFADFSNLVDASIEDAAETSAKPFVELLKIEHSKDKKLWKRQLAALRVLERLDPGELDNLKPQLLQHPSSDICNFVLSRFDVRAMDTITAEGGGYQLVKIPGGEFMMGSPESEEGRWDNEGPLHKVVVPAFYMGMYPVTNKEYAIFLKDNPGIKEPKYWADRRFNRPEQPVVGVSWHDAAEYAKWAGLRLPTEAEWEYACRASTNTKYYTGDKEVDLNRAGWYSKNSQEQTHPVGEKEPNSFGCYDMHGNVWEWMEDDWHGNYKGAPSHGKEWIDKPRGSVRVFRGGGWGNSARDCRSALRSRVSPDFRDDDIGFRLSRSVALGA